MDSELHIFVPYTLDERGRCCKSRVVTAGTADLPRVERYFRKQLGIDTVQRRFTPDGTARIAQRAPSDAGQPLMGLVHIIYEWDVDQYQVTSAATTVTGLDEGIDAATLQKFEEFDKTIQYYDRLNAKGQPFPDDAPVIHPVEPRWLRDAVTRARHSRRAPSKRTEFKRQIKFSRVGGFEHGGWRVPKSNTIAGSPLFPVKGQRASRARSLMNYPPKGCHPFIKERVASDKALAKIPASIRNKAFHVYELCDFGDVPRATREANFLALKRRKGVVTAHYNFYRHRFGIITDMKDGVAYLGLRGEFS